MCRRYIGGADEKAGYSGGASDGFSVRRCAGRYSGGADEKGGTLVGQMSRVVQWQDKKAEGYSDGADEQGVTVVGQMSGGGKNLGQICRGFIGGAIEQGVTVVGQKSRVVQWWDRRAGWYSGGAAVQEVHWWG
ncbi:hypothetical protein AB205_0168610, partial [Aquarana catesbeiana]